MIKLKRIYEAYSEEDGYRILVDRLYPRGIKKEAAHIDLWLKEIAPSHELRQYFNHDLDKWDTFKEGYIAELEANPEAVQRIRAQAEKGIITLLYAARDTEHNQAVLLKNFLENYFK